MKRKIVRDGMFSSEQLFLEASDRGTAEAQAVHEESMRHLERISTIDGLFDWYAEETEKALGDIRNDIMTPGAECDSDDVLIETGVVARFDSLGPRGDPERRLVRGEAVRRTSWDPQPSAA